MASGYLRHPHCSGDDVVFVADDDIWVVGVEGGRATRLTSDRTPASHPFLSPDGARVAFSSTRDGHVEAMVLDRGTGRVDRLTWWGRPTTLVRGWLPDGRVVVASDHGEPFSQRARLFAVDLDGRGERLPYGVAMSLAVHPAGAVAVTTPNSRDAAKWKRYRGGTASRLWLDPTGDGEGWRRLLEEHEAGVYSPIWVGDRLAFCSDLDARLPGSADGQAQLYSVAADGSNLRCHTAHTVDGRDGTAPGYVRDATTDGRRVAFHARGHLYVMDSLDAAPRRLAVDLGGVVPARRRVEPTDRLTQVNPDASGDASVVEWMGQAWWLTHRHGPTRHLLGDDSCRVREPRVVAGGRVLAVCDAGGADALHVVAADGSGQPQRVGAGGLGRVLHLQPSPAGDVAAVISHDGVIRLIDLGSGAAAEVGHSPHGEASDPVFSPDGRYLVWSEPLAYGELHRLMCHDRGAGPSREGGAGVTVPLTSGRFDDGSPSFTRDGRHLVFLSARTLDPTYGRYTFDLAFGDAVRPYLVPLAATTQPPFGPAVDGRPVGDVLDEEDKKRSSEEAAAAAVTCPDMDLDGFEERLVPFPVPSAAYATLRAVPDGVTWIAQARGGGVLGATRAGADGDGERDTLQFFSFATRKVTGLGDVDTYEVSGDGKRVVIRDRDRVIVVPSTHEVDEDHDTRVTVDLDRLRRDLDPRTQWRAMFEENGRLMRDHYWRADLDGVDWDAALATHADSLERVCTLDDLYDVLWECVGELNTSHCYVRPVAPFGDQSRRLGLLGADLAEGEGGVVVTRILPGESSDPRARSPLRAAGVGAVEGTRLLAVDGRPVTGLSGLGELLVGAAERVVELTVQGPGAAPRRVVVVPTGDEEALRYQDWVADRRRYVEKASGGRLGYLHVPDMMGLGWAQLHRDLDTQVAHEGLVVDVRYNRGGHTSQLVLERLSRRIVGWDVVRHGSPEPYPSQAPRGPLAFVCNQWSGSDGDIVNAAVQEYGLAPVIGERTWGGVVGIDGRFDLVDGTGVTQPRYAFHFDTAGWDVENHGVDPDIVVTFSPADWESDRDAQLDRAVEVLLARLAQTPASAPPELPAPRVQR